MFDPLELSDGEFLKWAGDQRQRWALLPCYRREAWLDHLIARMETTDDDAERNAFWRVAYVIASADTVPPSARAAD